mmetsp:Transcript_22332/g.47612  ORF Transcript_22332/g.47612 Transcript_22332/m.47612 type:complete len:464 (+) Transcript_22332:69-1460(+)
MPHASVSLLLALIRPVACLFLGKAAIDSPQSAYYWPTGRGPIGGYTSSPFSQPFNLSTPSWSWHHSSSLWSTIPVGIAIDEKKDLYLTAADGIRKFNPDGKLLWTYFRDLSGNQIEVINNAASLLDGSLFGITSLGRVFAVSMETGNELWSTKAASNADGNYGQVQAHGGVVITAGEASSHIDGRPETCCGPGNHVVIGLSATDGHVLWRYAPKVPVWNFMASFAEDGTFIFQDLEGRAHRCNASDGALIWKAGGVPGSWTDGSALLGPNGMVYTVANFKNGGFGPGRLSAFTFSEGKEIWRTVTPRPPNNMPAIGRLAGHSGLSVVQPMGQQCAQGQQIDVRAYDAKTGKIQWVFEGPKQQGRFVAGDAEGVSARSLNQIQTMTMPNPWGPPSIDAKGTVYLGGETGQFFALQDSNGDGRVEGIEEVSSFETGAAFVGSSGPALAPGMLAVGSINQLYVWKS